MYIYMAYKVIECIVFTKNTDRFSRPNRQFLPIHSIHILKAIVPAINLAYLDSLYVHPVIRPIFCNILGLIWQY